MPDQQIEMTRGVRQTSVRDVLNVLFRHKWKIAIFFLAAFGTVAVMTAMAPNSYRSEAKLLVRVGRESVALDPTATSGPMFEPSGRTRDDEIATELEILKSQAVARRVVDAVGPEALTIMQDKARNPILSWIDQLWPSSHRSEKSPDTKDTAVSGLSLMNTLSAEVSTTAMCFINVAYEAPDPRFAQQVLRKTIEAYLVEHIAAHRTPGSYEFFAQQYDMTQKRLDTLQSELVELKKKGDISSIDDQIRTALGREDRLKGEITTIESTVAASVARITKLKASLEGLPKTVVASTVQGQANPIVDSLQTNLNDLQLKIEDTISNYEENSRQVQSLRHQMQKINELLKQEQPTRDQVTVELNGTLLSIEQLLLEAEANLASGEAQMGVLKKDLAVVQAELPRLNEAQAKITDLTREITIEEANYQQYSEKRELARIDQALQADKISNIGVLQAATLPTGPSGPNRRLLYGLGLILGLVGAVSIALVAEFADHTLRTPEDVEQYLHLPTLASVPLTPDNIVGPAQARRSLLDFIMKRNRWESSDSWALPPSIRTQYVLLGEAVALNYELNGYTSSYGEQDTVPNPINEAKKQGSRKTKAKVHKSWMVGVVGPQGGEGVSVVAVNLAVTLAGQGRVLLVDANTTHPSAHEFFGMKVSLGLVDVLADSKNWQHAIGKTPVANLDLMPTGTAQEGVSEAEMDQLRQIVMLMNRQYDYIIVDLPPMYEAGYTRQMAGLCDNVGLVVEAGRSRWEVVQKTKEQLERLHANVSGVVLNKRRYYIPEWLYRAV